MLLLLHSRMIGREGDVDDDRHGRSDALAGHARTAAVVCDLLLRGRHGHHACLARVRRVATQRLEHHEGADPVVDRA